MNAALKQLRVLFKQYPVARGMVTYSLMWPAGCLVQQTFIGKTWETYDFKKCFRFLLYGGFFVAPTLYCWIRVSSAMWPQTNLRTGMTKAILEQISYTPAAMTCFYFGMSILEDKSVHEAAEEVRTKFIPTYKVAICVWPILQTINFTFVPERNRVPFVSVCSFLWTLFLSYMKELEHKQAIELNKTI